MDIPGVHFPDHQDISFSLADQLRVEGLHRAREQGLNKRAEDSRLGLQTCLELRDKYMLKSRQRLGDNPKDYDGEFQGLDDQRAGVSSVRPDTEYGANDPPQNSFDPWKILPPPPPPHQMNEGVVIETGQEDITDRDEFRFEGFDIPGHHHGWDFEMDDKGVFQLSGPVEFDVPSVEEYSGDLKTVLRIISDGPTKSFATRRLKYLSGEFTRYGPLKELDELKEVKEAPHRDFYNIRKVDTHVHHSACMSVKHLLRFIRAKMKHSPNDIVLAPGGTEKTLEEVFKSLNLSAYNISIDTLDMHAHMDSFERFDIFNSKYSPVGEAALRDVFLKTDNYIRGRYLAEITKEVMSDLEESKYQNCEWRLSIYGKSTDEWDKLAKWIVDNKLYSHNVRWLIQVPRLYEIYKKIGSIQNFEEIINNIFRPLFEVTRDPTSHPELHVFLQRVIGFDSVDDESKIERETPNILPYPRFWDTEQSPPYSYWIYYMYANIASVNNWRHARGFNTFVLRPHCGEAGDPDHLAASFLASHSISHGIQLRKVPALQYLYYLKQIGIAMSPLSNNSLFLTYERNPFPDFFKIGLNISLSTDDPLLFHFTKEPLLEEYGVAAHIYKLPPSSLAEIARNSVIQSGYEMEIKRHWLGDTWYLPGAAGNDISKTNVPDRRLIFRYETLLKELRLIHDAGSGSPGS